MAVGHDRDRLRTPKVGGAGHDSIDQLLTDPKLKGKVTLLTEMADTIGLVMLANGDDPARSRTPAFDRAIADDPEGRHVGPDPPVHRQRLRAAAREGRHLGGFAWSGDMVQLQRRQPEPEVGRAGGGRR